MTIMVKIIDRLSSWQKSIAAITHDFIVAVAVFYLAFTLRLGEWFPAQVQTDTFLILIFFIPITQTLVFYFNGLYKGLWRYSSTTDLLKVIRAATLAVFISFSLAFVFTRLENVPRSIFFINWMLLIMGLGGGRFLYRIIRDHYQYGNRGSKNLERVLIVGAGAGGERLLREINRDDTLSISVIGFVDDDPGLKGRSIHNVTVLGSTTEMPELIKDYQIKKVFIAVPSASGKEIRRIYELIKNRGVEIKILPGMSEIFQGRIDFSKLEEIQIEDLLGRDEVELNLEPIKQMLQGKRVLVTGAGGSIGSELCRQLAKFHPERLIAFDISEFNIYSLDQDLKGKFPGLSINSIVGDVRNKDSVEHLFNLEKPDVVLHAAAYKHVPLMEFNPFEAIRTNILGTKTVCEAASKFNTEKFVLVSTDKAVNPTNIMGATKRVAEMVVEKFNSLNPKTKNVAVRFGNVLGSSGSVIPLFRKQIASGGPVTVTDEEITRYFMSIPEASKLVLQAGSIGEGGELFVLDMGEPIKIMDMAREMISLAGLEVGVDVEIQVTGLRPGEKLYEEPLMDSEQTVSTSLSKVKICKTRTVDDEFEKKLEILFSLTSSSNRDEFITSLCGIVPEYRPYK